MGERRTEGMDLTGGPALAATEAGTRATRVSEQSGWLEGPGWWEVEARAAERARLGRGKRAGRPGQGRKRTGRAQGKEEKGPVSGLGRDQKRKGSGLGCWGLGRPGGKRATWAGWVAGFRSGWGFLFSFPLFFFKPTQIYLNSNPMHSTEIKPCTSMNAQTSSNLEKF